MLAVLVTLVYQLERADRQLEQWRRAHQTVLEALVKAETDLAIQRMLNGGEIARLTRELQHQTTD